MEKRANRDVLLKPFKLEGKRAKPLTFRSIEHWFWVCPSEGELPAIMLRFGVSRIFWWQQNHFRLRVRRFFWVVISQQKTRLIVFKRAFAYGIYRLHHADAAIRNIMFFRQLYIVRDIKQWDKELVRLIVTFCLSINLRQAEMKIGPFKGVELISF